MPCVMIIRLCSPSIHSSYQKFRLDLFSCLNLDGCAKPVIKHRAVIYREASENWGRITASNKHDLSPAWCCKVTFSKEPRGLTTKSLSVFIDQAVHRTFLVQSSFFSVTGLTATASSPPSLSAPFPPTTTLPAPICKRRPKCCTPHASAVTHGRCLPSPPSMK